MLANYAKWYSFTPPPAIDREHSRHRHHLVTVSRLRAETGDGDIRRLFNTASALHENFYENTLQAFEVAEGLDDVEALLVKLTPLLNPT